MKKNKASKKEEVVVGRAIRALQKDIEKHSIAKQEWGWIKRHVLARRKLREAESELEKIEGGVTRVKKRRKRKI